MPKWKATSSSGHPARVVSSSGMFRGDIDYRDTIRDGKAGIEWSWDGRDEMDPAQGHGWAVMDSDAIHGIIAFHQGDESEFVAKRKDEPALKPKKPSR